MIAIFAGVIVLRFCCVGDTRSDVFLRVAVYSSGLALSALEVCPVCLQAKLLDTDSSATVLTHPQFISREYQPGASPERKHQDCLPSKPARQPGPPLCQSPSRQRPGQRPSARPSCSSASGSCLRRCTGLLRWGGPAQAQQRRLRFWSKRSNGSGKGDSKRIRSPVRGWLRPRATACNACPGNATGRRRARP